MKKTKPVGRPSKKQFECNLCERTFQRKNNLSWHLAAHQKKAGSPVITDNSEGNMDFCPECMRWENKHDKQDDKIRTLRAEIDDQQNRFANELESSRGHHSFSDLLNCDGPECGSRAVEKFEEEGGAVVPPGLVKPELIKMVKAKFPTFKGMLEKGLKF
jgi:hypothetical protein